MGTAPSKPLSTPARPFQRNQRRVCLTNALLPTTRKSSSSILLQLIARREWQKVLIRVSLFPAEVAQTQTMSWYGVEWSLLPLHLACALQPPPQVVAMLLHYHWDTARVRMNRCHDKKKKGWRSRRILKRNKSTSITNRVDPSNMSVKLNDTAPSSDEEEGQDQDLNIVNLNCHDSSFDSDDDLDHRAFDLELDNSRSFYVFEESDDGTGKLLNYDEQAEDKSIADDLTATRSNRSLDSLDKFLGLSGLVLQLKADGSLHPIPAESLGVPQRPPKSRMQWDLEPLLDKADGLLPLHIACLYRAAPQVIAHLLKVFPKAVFEPAIGMLPIHMSCAGFDLPAPVEAPPPQVPFPMEDEWDLAPTLEHLVKLYPECLNFHSDYNGMAPQEYIEETMEDSPYRDKCLGALGLTTSATKDDSKITSKTDLDEDSSGTSTTQYEQPLL